MRLAFTTVFQPTAGLHSPRTRDGEQSLRSRVESGLMVSLPQPFSKSLNEPQLAGNLLCNSFRDRHLRLCSPAWISNQLRDFPCSLLLSQDKSSSSEALLHNYQCKRHVSPAVGWKMRVAELEYEVRPPLEARIRLEIARSSQEVHPQRAGRGTASDWNHLRRRVERTSAVRWGSSRSRVEICPQWAGKILRLTPLSTKTYRLLKVLDWFTVCRF